MALWAMFVWAGASGMENRLPGLHGTSLGPELSATVLTTVSALIMRENT